MHKPHTAGCATHHLLDHRVKVAQLLLVKASVLCDVSSSISQASCHDLQLMLTNHDAAPDRQAQQCLPGCTIWCWADVVILDAGSAILQTGQAAAPNLDVELVAAGQSSCQQSFVTLSDRLEFVTRFYWLP
jgi:hypothetical protein